jgi:hypothetical protein
VEFEDEIKKSGFDTYFIDHTTAVYPVAASGTPFTAAYLLKYKLFFVVFMIYFN